jgi:hypothetical protein
VVLWVALLLEERGSSGLGTEADEQLSHFFLLVSFDYLRIIVTASRCKARKAPTRYGDGRHFLSKKGTILQWCLSAIPERSEGLFVENADRIGP